MGLQNLQIIFDNPQGIYFSGQTVSGRLIVVTDSPKNLRSIVIKLKGEAQVHWTERHSERRHGKRHHRTIHYKGQETYFENKMMVFGRGNDTETLPTGEHSYQFSMLLPYNLPSSFETEHGYIRYTVKAILDRPWKFDHEAKAVFTVLSHLDLNMDPRNRQPVKVENFKTFCCCCCKSGPLTVVAMIPVTGYVCGQRIPITVEVDNASNVNVEKAVVELQKYVSLHATYPRKTKQYHVTVSGLDLDGAVPENDSKTWSTYFPIPPLPASHLRDCRIIDLEYKLKVKAKPVGVHRDLVIELPITIGTVPLTEAQPVPTAPMTGFAPIPSLVVPMPQPSAPPPDAAGASPNVHYPDIPPPSYEECMFGTKSIGDDEDGQYVLGITSYNPRYPTYNLPDAPPSYPGWAAPPPSDQPSSKQ